MSYTVHDTPAIVARVEHDLGVIEQTVREADPALRSLVLTGGFARGEGAVLDGKPQNDYDLIGIRGKGTSKVPYDELRQRLEKELGLHIDLAPVAAWRLPLVSPSIFWYETSWRGRVIWGDDLLDRIPIRTERDLDPTEGLRLLVNRAAGLLLGTESKHAHDLRIQAAKGFLAAFDAHMLAHGAFPPSQTERWTYYEALRAADAAPEGPKAFEDWTRWAFRFKVDPGAAEVRDATAAWKAARQAILHAVPAALAHARLTSLEAYARRDSLLDHLYYLRNARHVPGAPRFVLHPTGRVRLATLRLLEAAGDAEVRPEWARCCLDGLAGDMRDPLSLLQALRSATLQ